MYRNLDALRDGRQAIGGLGLFAGADFFLILDRLKTGRFNANLVTTGRKIRDLPLAVFVRRDVLLSAVRQRDGDNL